MPQLDGIAIPEPVVAAWREVIRLASDADVVAFARANPAYARGARLTRSGAPLIRKRLSAPLASSGDLPADLVSFLAREGLNGQLVIVLSVEALDAGFDEFAAVYGWHEWLAGLLVDSREPVRDLARERLHDEPSEDADAAAHLRASFRPFLNALQAWSGFEQGTGSDQDAAPATQEPNWESRLKTLEAELAESREKRTRIKQLQRKVEKTTSLLEQSKQAAAQSQQDLDACRARAAELEKALGEARGAVETWRGTLDARVAEQVDEHMRSLVNRWLRQAEGLDAAVRSHDSGSDDPLEESRRVLARQARVDRHHGNLAAVRARVETLNAALRDVRQAASEAINPLPELKRVAERLEEERSRLLQMAPQARAKPAVAIVEQLASRINQAADDRELAAIRGLLEDMATYDLLDRASLRQLYRRFHDRTARLYSEYMPRVVQGASASPTSGPGWVVCRGLAGELDVTWILDGHNVLHRMQHLLHSGAGAPNPSDAESRLLLTSTLKGVIPQRATCDTRLFFDSPRRSEKRHGPHLLEVFSGGGRADQRADDAIVDYIRFRASNPPPTTIVLVTDDRGLTRRAAELGALHMPVDELAALLEEATC